MAALAAELGLALRLTPRGLSLPRLLAHRPRAISWSTASRQAGKRSGGNGRSLRHLAFDDAHGVGAAQSIRVECPGRRSLNHQLADGKVREQQAPELLLNKVRCLAAQHGAGGSESNLKR